MDKKHVVITGAGSGLGASLAMKYAEWITMSRCSAGPTAN